MDVLHRRIDRNLEFVDRQVVDQGQIEGQLHRRIAAHIRRIDVHLARVIERRMINQLQGIADGSDHLDADVGVLPRRVQTCQLDYALGNGQRQPVDRAARGRDVHAAEIERRGRRDAAHDRHFRHVTDAQPIGLDRTVDRTDGGSLAVGRVELPGRGQLDLAANTFGHVGQHPPPPAIGHAGRPIILQSAESHVLQTGLEVEGTDAQGIVHDGGCRHGRPIQLDVHIGDVEPRKPVRCAAAHAKALDRDTAPFHAGHGDPPVAAVDLERGVVDGPFAVEAEIDMATQRNGDRAQRSQLRHGRAQRDEIDVVELEDNRQHTGGLVLRTLQGEPGRLALGHHAQDEVEIEAR